MSETLSEEQLEEIVRNQLPELVAQEGADSEVDSIEKTEELEQEIIQEVRWIGNRLLSREIELEELEEEIDANGQELKKAA